MDKRTPRYAGTVMNDELGWYKIRAIRKFVTATNANLKADGSDHRWRVVVKGRLGQDNAFAWCYRPGGKHYRHSSIDIQPHHAQRFDIYIYRRYN